MHCHVARATVLNDATRRKQERNRVVGNKGSGVWNLSCFFVSLFHWHSDGDILTRAQLCNAFYCVHCLFQPPILASGIVFSPALLPQTVLHSILTKPSS